jgi:hypothetical protein
MRSFSTYAFSCAVSFAVLLSSNALATDLRGLTFCFNDGNKVTYGADGRYQVSGTLSNGSPFARGGIWKATRNKLTINFDQGDWRIDRILLAGDDLTVTTEGGLLTDGKHRAKGLIFFAHRCQ